MKAEHSGIGRGHGRCRRCVAPAAARADCDPGRPARTRRRRDQLWQRRTDRVRLGFSLSVSPRFRAALSVRDQSRAAGTLSIPGLAGLPAVRLARYFLAFRRDRALHSAMAELPLIQRSLIEHEALVAEAGVPGLLAADRLDQGFSLRENPGQRGTRTRWRQGSTASTAKLLDGQALAAREPHLTGAFAGGVYLPAPGFVPDPGGLAKAYAALFTRKGGRFRWAIHDARTNGRRMAGQRAAWRAGRARRRGGTRTLVRSGVSVPWNIHSHSASSAVTHLHWRRAAMPCSIIPFSIRISVICWRR